MKIDVQKWLESASSCTNTTWSVFQELVFTFAPAFPHLSLAPSSVILFYRGFPLSFNSSSAPFCSSYRSSCFNSPRTAVPKFYSGSIPPLVRFRSLTVFPSVLWCMYYIFIYKYRYRSVFDLERPLPRKSTLEGSRVCPHPPNLLPDLSPRCLVPSFSGIPFYLPASPWINASSSSFLLYPFIQFGNIYLYTHILKSLSDISLPFRFTSLYIMRFVRVPLSLLGPALLCVNGERAMAVFRSNLLPSFFLYLFFIFLLSFHFFFSLPLVGARKKRAECVLCRMFLYTCRLGQ